MAISDIFLSLVKTFTSPKHDIYTTIISKQNHHQGAVTTMLTGENKIICW
jgi:uncharacterized damage-inducible protein DinB